MNWVSLALLLTGCVVQRGVAPDVLRAGSDADRSDWVFGPDVLVGDGLEVPVPFGWRGGKPASSGTLIAQLEHDETGVLLEVWGFASTGAAPKARPRAGGQHYFLDEAGTHRDAPALFPAIHGSWSSSDKYGSIVQGWYGLVGDLEVHIEAVYPPHEAVKGRLLVEEVLLRLGPSSP
jgi:hypothetical protein